MKAFFLPGGEKAVGYAFVYLMSKRSVANNAVGIYTGIYNEAVENSVWNAYLFDTQGNTGSVSK